MNAKKTKIKPKISVVLKESPLLSMQKSETKEESVKRGSSVDPFSMGEQASEGLDCQGFAPVVAV